MRSANASRNSRLVCQRTAHFLVNLEECMQMWTFPQTSSSLRIWYIYMSMDGGVAVNKN